MSKHINEKPARALGVLMNFHKNKKTFPNHYAINMPILTAFFLFGCTDDKTSGYNINQLFPQIVPQNEQIDVGEVVVSYSNETMFQILNAGRASLALSMNVSDNDDGVYTLNPTQATIPVNEAMSFSVDFTPRTYLEYERDIVIISNDPDQPQINLPLQGVGIDGPVPDINITPGYIDFGEVNQGSTRTEFFQIQNTGTGVLEIAEVSITGSEDFYVVNGFANTAYNQGQSTTVIVEYSPTAEEGDNATITIQTNDPDEPEATITFLGNGGGTFEYPVADYPCPEQLDPPTTISFNGANSYDPSGLEPLTYSWELIEKPEGSSTDFEDNDSPTTPLFIDSSGDYTVGLTVQNTIGLESEQELCSFTAFPDKSVQFELTWNVGNSDMDLHLIQRKDGEYNFYSYESDCCWCNPNPGWGDPGNADDPDLSLDNRVGYGPETIHIENPYEGTYGLFVHYFDDKGGGAATATLRIYINGVLDSEVPMVLTERDLWQVGQFVYSNGVGSFVVSNEDINANVRQECF